ncbi:nucleotidyltransferase family protein [Chloroflexota bacterium]
MKSIILASGFGTRLYPLTVNTPKCLLEYKGKPIINHMIDKIPEHLDILVTTNKKFETHFRRWQKTLDREVVLCVEPVFTEEQSLGAVGSLNYCVTTANISDDILVLAGDNYFEFNLSEFISTYYGKNALVAICDIGDESRARQFGVVQLDGQKIVRFDEKPVEPQSTLVATGCYLLSVRIFPLLSEFVRKGKVNNLGSFIAYLTNVDDVYAYTFIEPWVDIGSIDTYYSDPAPQPEL